MIERQRRRYFQELRDLTAISAAAVAEGNQTAQLLAEGAVLHVEADLKWLELCEAELLGGIPQ
jgi:hypothetical protein